MEKMEKAIAETFIEIWVHCPYCDNFQEVTSKLRNLLDDDLRASDLDKEIECFECDEIFIVDEITY